MNTYVYETSLLHRLCSETIARLDTVLKNPVTPCSESEYMQLNNFYRVLDEAKISALPHDEAFYFGQDRKKFTHLIQSLLVKLSGLTPKTDVSISEMSLVRERLLSYQTTIALFDINPPFDSLVLEASV